MTAQNPAIFLQAGSHPAEDVRRMFRAQSGAQKGVFEGMAVTQNGTPNMSVIVSEGSAMIPGSEATYQGSYFVENRGNTTLAIAAANATNPRYDLIVAKVEDAAYSGATNAWSLAVVTGTAAASPVEPSPPANSIVLARVTVGASVTSITNANITDRRTAQNGQTILGDAAAFPVGLSTNRPSIPTTGQSLYESDTNRLMVFDGTAWTVPKSMAGPYVCTSATRPTGSALFEGLVIYQTDTDHALVYNGTGWDPLTPEPWTSVSFVNGWQNFAAGTHATARYRKLNPNTCQLEGLIRLGTLGAPAFNLPTGYRPPRLIVTIQADGAGASRLDIESDGDVIPSPGGTGSNVYFSVNAVFSTV